MFLALAWLHYVACLPKLLSQELKSGRQFRDGMFQEEANSNLDNPGAHIIAETCIGQGNLFSEWQSQGNRSVDSQADEHLNPNNS